MKTRIISLIVAFVSLFFSFRLLNAQSNSITAAAKNFWFQKYQSGKLAQDFDFDRITKQENVFVFERFKPASFVIISQTSHGLKLVGYSLKNLFFEDSCLPAHQPKLLEALITSGAEDYGKSKGTRSLNRSIGPLIQTQWGQGKNFNYFCPKDSRGPNGRVYVGCVAVAMGQIIRYYAGFNTIDMQHEYHSGQYGLLSAKLGPYQWSAMENIPMTVNTEISDFLSDLGILVHMTYGASGSSTNSHSTLEAFHELGYIGGIILRKSKFSNESWAEVFFQNLLEYKPVLVTGGGHAFICDGFNQEGFFHFNLGWDGYGDGYYPLNVVMSLPVNEAFTELQPFSWPEPPMEIGQIRQNRQNYVTWRYESGQQPIYSRVYVNDKLYLETADTLFNISQLVPGIHTVSVSAVYPEGESRWIGPEEVFSEGSPLTIKDPMLYSMLTRCLGYAMSDTKELQICEGDLSRIISLVIDQPISSMEGLDLCNHLKRLVINGFPGPALDAGPLENLSELRILEWNGRSIVHPEAFEKLSQLSELRIRKTELASLDFLGHFTNLMKFEYSDAVVGNIDVLRHLPLLDELVLNRANLSDAQVILEMPNLIRLDLSGNQLKESDFLSESLGLIRADLSDNRISELTLGGKLQSLIEIDVSGNNIDRMFFSEELKLLQIIDLSYNKLVTPGKLFLYAPALINVDLNHNQLRDMGKHRCPNLVVMNVSNNQLITTDWVSLQPQLKIFNAEHNRISDLSDLVSNKLFQQLSFLGLDKNPLSKQSFLECLPILVNSIDSISKPQDYQPLSPCYVSPANGSQSVETDLEFRWFTEDTLQECVYDLLIVKGDSLVPVLRGINSLKAVLSPRPAPSFSWVIASRTADSVYYSGVNEVTSTIEWTVPFYEGFETYQEGKPLSQQSDIWLLTEKAAETSSTGGIVSSNFQTGNLSFKLSDNETLTLSAQHLKLPYLSIEFSVFIPPGQSGEFSVQNMNGIFFKLVWDESDIGRFYLNDKLFNTFSVDHLNWTDYEILAHARNESIYIRAGKQLIMNDPWMVPEGVICTESIAFSCFSDQSLFIDDIVITSSAGSSGLESADQPGGVSSVFPNPFTDHVQVTCSVPGRHEIRIVDLNGREVYRQLIDFEQRGTIDLALGFLEAGVYTLFSTDRRFVLVRLVRR